MRTRNRKAWWIWMGIVLLLSLACNLGSAGTSVEQPQAGVLETQVALAVMATDVAGQGTRVALTVEAQAQSQAVEAAQPTAAPTSTSVPTQEPLPTEPLDTSTPEPTLTLEPTPTPDLQAQIAQANILVFEDIIGYPELTPYVNRALGRLGLKGRIEQLGDAEGRFLQHLNSGTDWDLIIVATEARSQIKGEYWDLINQQLDRGAALIAEVWYLDRIEVGRVAPFLRRCGLDFQKNWERPFNFNPSDYYMFWLDPMNDVFNVPNPVNPLRGSTNYWMGDAGDFLKIVDPDKGTLLAGYYNDRYSDYGLIATCEEGRVILQTFSTHDFKFDPMVALWQNYITYTLKNHFLTAP